MSKPQYFLWIDHDDMFLKTGDEVLVHDVLAFLGDLNNGPGDEFNCVAVVSRPGVTGKFVIPSWDVFVTEPDELYFVLIEEEDGGTYRFRNVITREVIVFDESNIDFERNCNVYYGREGEKLQPLEAEHLPFTEPFMLPSS